MSTEIVTLYDLPCNAGNVCWSPNVLKSRPLHPPVEIHCVVTKLTSSLARLILNYKKIPYQTEWIDLPDIKPTLQAYGVQPKSAESAGASVGAQYTLPTIQLPDRTFVMDSTAIATSLEAAHPEPALHLETGLHDRAQEIVRHVAGPLFPDLMPRIRDDVITEHALPYWLETRESLFGMSIDEFALRNGGEQAWKAAEPGFGELVELLTEHKRDDGPFILGREVCYGDFVIVAAIESLRMSAQEIFERFVGYDQKIEGLYSACRPWLEVSSEK